MMFLRRKQRRCNSMPNCGECRITQRMKRSIKDKQKKPDDKSPTKLKLMPDALPRTVSEEFVRNVVGIACWNSCSKETQRRSKKTLRTSCTRRKSLTDTTSLRPTFVQLVRRRRLRSWRLRTGAMPRQLTKQALVDRPRSGFPLYGIAMASEQADDVTAAYGRVQGFPGGLEVCGYRTATDGSCAGLSFIPRNNSCHT